MYRLIPSHLGTTVAAMSAPPPTLVQDMPPAGGYQPLHWQKTIRPKAASGVAWFGGFTVWSITWYLLYKHYKKFQIRDEFEMKETRIALEPFLLAETDRNILKTLWINREEERELMKDERGWVVGTWYGDKCFNDTSRIVLPTKKEYYAHCSPSELRRRINEKFWH